MIWSLIGSIVGKFLDPKAITETGFISRFAEPLESAELLTDKQER